MKMVKSLLFVSAAGLVAVAGAQAADLPVKAKPVEYVKVCSLYGAGFYYVPGTDICLKVGGYIRYQAQWNYGTSQSGGPMTGAGGYNNRMVNNDFSQRTRAIATFDSRQQTAYGTLRTYLLMGFNQDTTAAPSTAPTVYMTRGFIQLAGFTFGKATSYFDFVSTAAVAYNAGMLHTPDTGDAGQIVAAYTAQLGNGVSASVAVEQSRRLATANTNIAGVYGFPTVSAVGVVAANVVGSDNAGGGALPGVASLPDIVANLRVDQAWGAAQISGALHDASAGYYAAPAGVPSEINGHPGSKMGWAVSAGLRLNTPMIGPGDYFQGAVHYAQGATKYTAGATPTGGNPLYFTGNSVGFGFYEDAVFGGTATAPGAFGNSINLTTSWSVMASYEHFWTPSLRTSVYGSYIDISHNANANGLICTSLVGTFAASVATCNMNFSSYNVGTRSQWNITKDLYVGLDVVYEKLNSANTNGTTNTVLVATTAGGTGKPGGFYNISDQDIFAATWRIHRDIVP